LVADLLTFKIIQSPLSSLSARTESTSLIPGG
jgi:hypothetical protein